QVEFAPNTINRFGITYAIKHFSTTFLVSNTSKSFADANNTIYSADATVGLIPAYQVMDWSASVKIKNYNIKLGVNNLADKRYFTLRTDEYPGPGIIPSIARSFYIGFGAKF
ncbi:MAG TPA: TonB-dependent receptor, partial [Bacteroidia bacterium]|nr:TonB-dependent receptor [Bacteroidia bacterium]